MAGIDVLTQLGAAPWVQADADNLRYTLQRARYDLMGVASRRALSGDLRGGNQEVATLLATDAQMYGWVVVNPAYPAQSSEEMRRYCSSPRWLGAMLPRTGHRQSLSSAMSRDVINAFRRYTRPLLVDIPDEPAVRELEALALEFATMKFIAAGAGGDHWQACALAAKRAVNIILEPFSGGQHRGKLEAILQTLGPHRVLFASGYPDVNPGAAFGVLTDAGISDAERQAGLSGNATRLFNLGRE